METVACNLCGSEDHRFIYRAPDGLYFLDRWFDVLGAHPVSRASTSDGRPWAPEGSLFAPLGGRQRRLTLSRIAGATLPTQKTRKDDHTYHPIVIEGTYPRWAELPES